MISYRWPDMHACLRTACEGQSCKYVWMYGCLDVWMYGCLDVHMNMSINEWINRWLDACMYVYTFASMYVCMYVRMSVCMYVCIHVCLYTCMSVHMYVCVHVCVYSVCECVWVYIFVRTSNAIPWVQFSTRKSSGLPVSLPLCSVSPPLPSSQAAKYLS